MQSKSRSQRLGRSLRKGLQPVLLCGHKNNSAFVLQSLENDFAQSYSLKALFIIEKTAHCQVLLVKYLKIGKNLPKGLQM